MRLAPLLVAAAAAVPVAGAVTLVGGDPGGAVAVHPCRDARPHTGCATVTVAGARTAVRIIPGGGASVASLPDRVAVWAGGGSVPDAGAPMVVAPRARVAAVLELLARRGTAVAWGASAPDALALLRAGGRIDGALLLSPPPTLRPAGPPAAGPVMVVTAPPVPPAFRGLAGQLTVVVGDPAGACARRAMAEFVRDPAANRAPTIDCRTG